VPSAGQMIDEVVSTLSGHTADVPAMGTLTQSITATDGQLHVDFGSTPGGSRPNGIIEIGRELLVVTQFDAASGVATVPAWGRGHRGTVAVSHPAGSMVTVRPRFPRQQVLNAINECIGGLAPDLYGVADLVVHIDSLPALSYPLPAGAFKVIGIEAQVNAAYPYRETLQDWTLKRAASGLEVEPRNRLWAPYFNRDLTITYGFTPQPLVNDTDDYTTVTGLDATSYDIPILGALARLALSVESSRLQLASVEANARTDRIQPGSGTSLAKTYMALYQQRLQSEIAGLQARYPLTLVKGANF
jgi:hypothetical protein